MLWFRCLVPKVWRFGTPRTFPNSDLLPPLSLISYFSTTVQPLTTPIPNPKREGGGERARAPPRPSRLTRNDFAWPSHVLPTDRQTPPAGRVALIPRWNTRRSASAPRVAPPRAPDLWKAINDDAVIRRWQLQCGSFCSYRYCYLLGQSRTLGIFGVSQLTQNFS